VQQIDLMPEESVEASGSNILRSVDVPVVSNDQCNKDYHVETNSNPILDEQVMMMVMMMMLDAGGADAQHDPPAPPPAVPPPALYLSFPVLTLTPFAVCLGR
jgi:hypothetical protein